MYYFLLSTLWFKGCTSWVDTTVPGSGLCLCEVLWRQSSTAEVQNRTECHNRTVTDIQEDTQTRLPNPQQREHNSRENKRTELFFFLLFILGELPQLFSQPAELRAACTGLSPLPRLQQHTPHPPDWPCHTTARQNPPQPATNRLGLHTGTLTLTPDFPRLTITLGGWGAAFRDHPGHDDSAGHNNAPSPILSLTCGSCVFIRPLILGRTRSALWWKQQVFRFDKYWQGWRQNHTKSHDTKSLLCSLSKALKERPHYFHLRASQTKLYFPLHPIFFPPSLLPFLLFCTVRTLSHSLMLFCICLSLFLSRSCCCLWDLTWYDEMAHGLRSIV